MYEVEIWEDINNYEYRYEVSNLGRVRNKKTGRILSPTICSKGFKYVTLFAQDRVSNMCGVHRLVAEHFVKWNGKYRVSFIDGNRSNCNANNLEW